MFLQTDLYLLRVLCIVKGFPHRQGCHSLHDDGQVQCHNNRIVRLAYDSFWAVRVFQSALYKDMAHAFSVLFHNPANRISEHSYQMVHCAQLKYLRLLTARFYFKFAER